MNYFDVDKIIVIVFLLITLIAGLIAGRNVREIRDFAIADKSYSTFILLLTLLATLVGGGSTIGDAAQLFDDGIVFWVLAIGPTISAILLARYILPKLDDRFQGMISASDMMGYFYGPVVEKFSAIIGFLMSMGFLSMQLVALAHLVSNFLGMSYVFCLTITSVLVITYSTFGGVRSVTITDIIQFFMLIAMIPIIANVATNEIGGLGNLFEIVKNTQHTEIIDHPKFNYYLTLGLVLSVPFSLFLPSTIQRYLMAQRPKQIVYITYSYAVLNLVIVFMATCIALSALRLAPEIASKEIIPHIINSFIPPIIRGFAISGMIAVVMSTADSFLNSGAVLMAHNAFPKRCLGSRINPLHLAKIFTLVGGVAAMIVAMQDYNMVSILILSCVFSSTIFGIPLIFGVLGFKVHPICFWSGIISGFTTYIIASYIGLPNGTPLIIVALTLLGFLLSYIIINRSYDQLRNINFSIILENFQNYIDIEDIAKKITKNLPFPRNIYNYSTEKVKKFGANYVMFGIFCSVDYIVPYFLWTEQKPINYLIVLSLRLIAGILCIGLFLQEYWFKLLKKYFAVYWHFTLVYCLPFVNTVMFITMRGDVEWLVNFALSTMLLALLVDWVSFTILLLLGVTCGYIFYGLVMGAPAMLVNPNTIYLLIYICIFATLVGILFARRKELDNEEKLEVMQLFGGAIAHEVKAPLSTINMCSQRLEFDIARVVEKAKSAVENQHLIQSCYELNEVAEMLKKTSIQAIGTVNSLLASLKGAVIAEDKGEYRIIDCLNKILNNYISELINPDNINIDIAENMLFYGSMHYMEQVFTNLLNNAFKYGGRNVKIHIWSEDNKIYVQDNGLGISEHDLPHIFDRFYTKSKDGTGIGLAFCKMVMKDLGGDIHCMSKVGEYTRFILEFPKIAGDMDIKKQTSILMNSEDTKSSEAGV